MEKSFHSQKIIPLEVQNFNIKLKFSEFHYRWINSTGVWVGYIKPTPISCSYKIKITYKIGSLPKAEVIEPELQVRDGEVKIPHTYPNKRPCVYYPKTDWDKSKLLAQTVIPWLSLWLYYYEVWYITGDWLGEGRHPDSKPNPSKKDENVNA